MRLNCPCTKPASNRRFLQWLSRLHVGLASKCVFSSGSVRCAWIGSDGHPVVVSMARAVCVPLSLALSLGRLARCWVKWVFRCPRSPHFRHEIWAKSGAVWGRRVPGFRGGGFHLTHINPFVAGDLTVQLWQKSECLRLTSECA